MKRLQAFKFELMPNGEQVRSMKRFVGACRFIYNHALAWQKESYENDQTTKFSYAKLQNHLPVLKKNTATA
jgi:putative transposase